MNIITKDLVLPHRFRESSFRFYEPFIAKVLESLPRASAFDPKKVNLSPETFSARFRDAMRSFLDNDWWTTMFDREQFLKERTNIVVSPRNDGNVWIGPREAIKLLDVKTPEVEIAKNEEPFDIGLVSFNTIGILCMLAGKRCLCRPISFKPCLGEQPVADLQDVYDIDLAPQADGSFILT